MRDVGRELAAARVSASPGLVHCRQGPPALPPLLSAGSAAAKKTAKQGTVYLCRLYSLHILAAGLRHHSNLPGSAKKGSADLLSTTVCMEVPGVQINRRQCPSSVRHYRPNNPTSPPQPTQAFSYSLSCSMVLGSLN